MRKTASQRRLQPFPWTGADSAEYGNYMHREWGVPVRRDRRHFELLTLELFQAGLSWATILKRRAAFRHAFADWDFFRVAAFGRRDAARLLRDEGIIRNRAKIAAAINNAARFVETRREFGSFNKYIWGFTGGKTVRPARPYASWAEVPARSPLSEAVGAALRSRGFKFTGPVMVYSYLQAAGIVDDRVWL